MPTFDALESETPSSAAAIYTSERNRIISYQIPISGTMRQYLKWACLPRYSQLPWKCAQHLLGHRPNMLPSHLLSNLSYHSVTSASSSSLCSSFYSNGPQAVTLAIVLCVVTLAAFEWYQNTHPMVSAPSVFHEQHCHTSVPYSIASRSEVPFGGFPRFFVGAGFPKRRERLNSCSNPQTW